jgi:ABC-type transport system substrate-binding protein
MLKSSILRFLALLAAMALVLYLILTMFSRLSRPDMSTKIKKYSPEELTQVEKLREIIFDMENPPSVYKEVDYSEGKSGAWYPKNESPLFADLVMQGKLPPLVERIGEEPAVIEGVDGIGNYGGTWVRMAINNSDIPAVARERLGHPSLVRWSPQGYPIVPHLAKSYTVSDDYTEFVFKLRKGVIGHPAHANP